MSPSFRNVSHGLIVGMVRALIRDVRAAWVLRCRGLLAVFWARAVDPGAKAFSKRIQSTPSYAISLISDNPSYRPHTPYIPRDPDSVRREYGTITHIFPIPHIPYTLDPQILLWLCICDWCRVRNVSSLIGYTQILTWCRVRNVTATRAPVCTVKVSLTNDN
jgi:hypothetical protein